MITVGYHPCDMISASREDDPYPKHGVCSVCRHNTCIPGLPCSLCQHLRLLEELQFSRDELRTKLLKLEVDMRIAQDAITSLGAAATRGTTPAPDTGESAIGVGSMVHLCVSADVDSSTACQPAMVLAIDTTDDGEPTLTLQVFFIRTTLVHRESGVPQGPAGRLKTWHPLHPSLVPGLEISPPPPTGWATGGLILPKSD